LVVVIFREFITACYTVVSVAVTCIVVLISWYIVRNEPPDIKEI